MTKTKQVRHGRVHHLLKLRLAGADYNELMSKCLMIPVSKGTAKSYIEEVESMVDKMRKARDKKLEENK